MHSLASNTYVGRFAPSPSGPLHFGSLVCALASYLDARVHKGKWLVRMEDIDPPREEVGASERILTCLSAHGLHWDGEVLFQASRAKRYNEVLKEIEHHGLSYFCTCSRKRVQALERGYDGHCRSKLTAPTDIPAAIRLNTALACAQEQLDVVDDFQGIVRENYKLSGDFVIHRKDGLYAYQLAVSVDDIDQGITHIVRGIDLLDATPKQVLMMRVLNATPPSYAHIPIIVDAKGNKLSKQNHAQPIAHEHAVTNLLRACQALFAEHPRELNDATSILTWATERWSSCYRNTAETKTVPTSIKEIDTRI